MTSQFSESDHPRTGDGKFKTKEQVEAEHIDLTAAALDPYPAAPLSAREVDRLAEYRGRFVDGYTPEDINSFGTLFDSARLTCVWDVHDESGYGGNSEIVGRALGSQASGPFGAGRAVPAERGDYRPLHPQVVEFLFESDSDVDPEQIPSLLADETHDGPSPDGASTDDGFHNVAMEDQATVCESCGEHTDEKDSTGTLMCQECQDEYQCRKDGCANSIENGDGWDGYCSTDSDLISAHDNGEHSEDSDPECPVCP